MLNPTEHYTAWLVELYSEGTSFNGVTLSEADNCQQHYAALSQPQDPSHALNDSQIREEKYFLCCRKVPSAVKLNFVQTYSRSCNFILLHFMW